MSLPKITGIETEYAIYSGPRKSPFAASKAVLRECERMFPNACSNPDGGFMLPNGSRVYIDHGHPEYASPETLDPMDTLASDKAGEILLGKCLDRANKSRKVTSAERISLYKNNCDFDGNTYGCHENYLVTPDFFYDLVHRNNSRALKGLIPFLVTRSIICGSGKIGGKTDAAHAGFRLSQRADHFKTVKGLQTTFQRPILNTRDEPHADPASYKRLHVITGDANMAEYSTFLKVGTMQIVLSMLEDGMIGPEMMPADPILAMHGTSEDTTFNRPILLENGKKVPALEIQKHYLDLAKTKGKPPDGFPSYEHVLSAWEDVLAALSHDWRRLSTTLDWAVKRNLFERFLEARGITWEDFSLIHDSMKAGFPGVSPKERETCFHLWRMDIEYHEIGPGHALFQRLQEKKLVDRLVTDACILGYTEKPPTNTRAAHRVSAMEQHAGFLRNADWEYIEKIDSNGLVSRLEFMDPMRRPFTPSPVLDRE